MIDDTKLQKDSARGVRAQQLLDNELLKEVFAQLTDSYSEALFNTAVLDHPAREKFYLAVNIVRKVQDHLAMVAMDGRVAQSRLNDLASTGERKKRLGII